MDNIMWRTESKIIRFFYLFGSVLYYSVFIVSCDIVNAFSSRYIHIQKVVKLRIIAYE